MNTVSVTSRITRLADRLTADGYLTDQTWRRALHAVPRHLFAPSRAYAAPGHDHGPDPRVIDLAADPDRWWDAVYSDMSIVTQRDDGAGDPASPEGLATCSLSAPCVVFPFLEMLAPEPGQRIMEIGTGTGWTAALLAHRIGQHAVTSIEIDPALMAVATANLNAAGYAPNLLIGDGADGCRAGAPFDGIHVTCGVRTIPHEWVTQLRPGAVAVLPWMPDGQAGYRVRLVADGHGTATGMLHGPAGYMMLRAQRGTRILWRPHHADQADVTTTSTDPREISRAGTGAALAITATVPGLLSTPWPDDDGSLSLHLAEAGNPDGSWAACDSSDTGKHQVTQYGQRRLWDETEAAYHSWISHGSPGRADYRLTVTPAGQHLSLHDLEA